MVVAGGKCIYYIIFCSYKIIEGITSQKCKTFTFQCDSKVRIRIRICTYFICLLDYTKIIIFSPGFYNSFWKHLFAHASSTSLGQSFPDPQAAKWIRNIACICNLLSSLDVSLIVYLLAFLWLGSRKLFSNSWATLGSLSEMGSWQLFSDLFPTRFL